MAGEVGDLFGAAQSQLQSNDAELAFMRERQFVEVVRQGATGSGDMNALFSLDRNFRLVFVRCHFTGGTGTAPLTISVDSGLGSAYDATLFTVSVAGIASDVHLRIGGGDTQEPSAWTFQSNDSLHILWTNPDTGNMTWGLEVGLVPVS